jgi:hypothetical protein
MKPVFMSLLIQIRGKGNKIQILQLESLSVFLQSRRMKWAGHVARMGEKGTVCSILVGKPEGKRPLRRTRRRWVDDIKMDLREIGWDGADWVDMAQDRD